MISEMCIELQFIFSTMPELHINGRISYHNSSLENNAFGASYDTSSSFTVIKHTLNSTIAFSTTTNTVDTENSFCGIVFSIFCFCLALAFIISIGMCLIRKRQNTKTQESQEFNESFEMKPRDRLPIPCILDTEQTPYK